MHTFQLDPTNKRKEFVLRAPTSTLKLGKVSLQLTADSPDDWPSVLAQLQLNAMLRHTVMQTDEINDQRTESIRIHLGIDPSQKQPVILLNQIIENKPFKTGHSDQEHFYSELVLEIDDADCKGAPWSLLFECELSECDEK